MKTCTRCHVEQPIDHFWLSGGIYMASCIDCTKGLRKVKRELNRSVNLERGGPDPSVLEKKCSAPCKRLLPISYFGLDFARTDGYRTACKVCRLYQALKDNYGLTLEQYEEILNRQNWSCAWCGRHQDTLPDRLFVDHCHETGIVRRLLCRECNTAEGMIKKAWPEALAVLNSMATYSHKD